MMKSRQLRHVSIYRYINLKMALNTALLKDAVKIVNHALRQMDILCGCLIRIYGIEPLAPRQQLHQMKLQ